MSVDIRPRVDAWTTQQKAKVTEHSLMLAMGAGVVTFVVVQVLTGLNGAFQVVMSCLPHG